MSQEHSQVFQVASRELNVRYDFDDARSLLADLHAVAQVANSALDLDAVVQKLFKGGDVEDLVRSGLGGVDGKLEADQ